MVPMMERRSDIREKTYEVIFEADTPAGKAFDVILLVLILASVTAVLLESMATAGARYGYALRLFEWIVTVLFTIEYLLRIWCVQKPGRYITSFFGLIDLLAVLPTYLSVLFSGTQYLLVIRVVRLLRVFRILKMAHFLSQAQVLGRALRASMTKIMIFVFAVLTIVVIVGATMFLVEGPAHGFRNIPVSMYWAIVTLTTVGYGDISPQTPLGQTLASLLMILGYGIIAVPTGIVTVELGQASRAGITTQVCPGCYREGHAPDAVFCKYCGERLNPP